MGTVRLFLALAVIAFHTGIGKSFPIEGREAVVLFYLISGFYMAMILNTKYVGHGSTLRFYKSRYLRLWVPYIVVSGFYLVGLSLSIIKLPAFSNINQLPLPQLIANYCSIFFIFWQDLFYLFSVNNTGHLIYLPYDEPGFNGYRFIINPVVFSISLELCFYMLAPFVLRSFNKTVIFTTIGFLWHLYFNLKGNKGLDVEYHLFPSTFLFFGLGAISYWVMIAKNKFKFQAVHLCLFMILIMLPWMEFVARWLLVALFFFSIPAIFNLPKNFKIDRIVGELSYPVYLVHFPVILIIIQHVKPQTLNHLFFYTTTLSIVLAFILHWAVEKPLSKYREQFARG